MTHGWRYIGNGVYRIDPSTVDTDTELSVPACSIVPSWAWTQGEPSDMEEAPERPIATELVFVLLVVALCAGFTLGAIFGVR